MMLQQPLSFVRQTISFLRQMPENFLAIFNADQISGTSQAQAGE
jgi:hypothetical protein